MLVFGGILGALVIALGLEWNRSQQQPAPGLAQVAVTQAIRADLLRIGRAQQAYFADNSRFGTIEELISSGALAMKKPSRGVYLFTAEVTDRGFIVTARAQGEEAGRWPALFINERMEITEEAAAAGRN